MSDPLKPEANPGAKDHDADLPAASARRFDSGGPDLPLGATLALNCAEGRLQIALGLSEPSGAPALKFAQDWHAPTQGAELLIPALQDALKLLGLHTTDISAIAAVNGPGGFTGLRLALATASGLSRALGVPQAGINYLDLLAAHARLALQTEDALAVFIHARRGLIQGRIFAPDFIEASPALRPLTPMTALTPDECPDFFAATGERAFTALGSGFTRNRETLAGCFAAAPLHLRILPPFFDHVPPAVLLRQALALPASAYSRRDISPIYLRPSDAEENLEQIAEKLGHNPADSRARLESMLTSRPDSSTAGSA